MSTAAAAWSLRPSMLASGGTSTREPALTRDSIVSSTPPAFGRFRVVHQVGAGVHGPVFLAADSQGDRQVAIKTFPLDITPERAATLAAALRQLVSTPLGHPSIVPLLDAGSEGSTVYLAQEYVLAESVDAAVREYGPAQVPDALRLIGQLAGAIDFAAVAGVHHGALHPRDVLVAPNEVRLTGLGVAEAFEQVGLRVASRRPYSAPERQERRAWGTPADVFSLAAVGFEMLTGRRPGSAEAIAADTRSIPAPDPAALAEVFARALSARPADRFQTALAFAASLRHALTGEPIDLPDAGRGRAEAADRAALVAPVPLAAADAAIADRAAAPEEPAPVAEEPAPAAEAAAPVVTEQPPAVAEQAPAVAEQAPAAEEPAPVAEEPAPSTDEPAPSTDEPPPVVEQPQPVGEPAVVAEDAPLLAAGEEPPRLEEPGLVPAHEEVAPPELALFAPEASEHDQRFAAIEEDDEASEVIEETPPAPAVDEFRRADAPSEVEEPPAGPVELGEDTQAPPSGSLPLPLEIEMESERPPAPLRSSPPAAPPERPAVPPAPPIPPVMPRHDPGLAPRRTRFPVSSLLAMLLLGIVAGFIGGYLVGRSEPSAAVSSEAPASESSNAPASEVTRPEPVTPAPPAAQAGTDRRQGRVEELSPAPQAGADATQGRVEEPPPAPVPSAGATAAPPARVPSRTSAARRPAPPAANRDEEPDGPFEAPLSVISRPPGALVRLDGRAVGKTPLRLSAIRAGAHVVRLELNGYLPWSSAIQVVSGAQNRVTASLERRPGGIE